MRDEDYLIFFFFFFKSPACLDWCDCGDMFRVQKNVFPSLRCGWWELMCLGMAVDGVFPCEQQKWRLLSVI